MLYLLKNFYKFLMGRDLSEFDPQTDRPITEAARELMAGNTPPVASFLQSCVIRKEFCVRSLLDSRIPWQDGTKISAKHLFGAFKLWGQEEDDKRCVDINHKSFGKQLRKIYVFTKDTITSGDKRGGVAYVLPAPQKVEDVLRSCGKWDNNMC